jgi:hypothetical protein
VAARPARPDRRPAPRPFAIEGGDERFVVHDGRVHAVVPFNAEKAEGPRRPGAGVRHRAGIGTLCHRPADERREPVLGAADLIRK